MAVAVGPHAATGQREALRNLAHEWNERGWFARWRELRALTHKSLRRHHRGRGQCGRCRDCLWADYREDQALLDAYENGEVGPDDIDPDGEIAVVDREAAVRDQLAMCAAGTADVLLRGWPAPTVAPVAVKACA